jgi:hypothetical protein
VLEADTPASLFSIMAENLIDPLIPGLTNPALQKQPNSDALFDGIQHCTLCGRVIEGRFAMVRAKIACVSCAARERDSATRMSTPVRAASRPSSVAVADAIPDEESGAFAPALFYGIGAAVVGLVVYASFTIITHWYFGYVALLVGWMVGKAIMQGSGGVGGLRYQITAVVLTYAAISLASVPIAIARAADQGLAIDWGTMAGPLLLGGIISPFLKLQQGPYGIIGLVILFVGLRVAFRLTREKQPQAATR